MAACKLMWCPKDPNELARFLTDDFGPLLAKHWDKETARTGVQHSLDVPAFMAAWEQRGIALVMAYDGDKAAGFMPLYIFRPLFMLGTVVTVERWYAESPAVEKSMFDYLVSVVPVLGVDQVHVAQHDGQHIPDHIELDMSDDYRMSRLKV